MLGQMCKTCIRIRTCLRTFDCIFSSQIACFQQLGPLQLSAGFDLQFQVCTEEDTAMIIESFTTLHYHRI